MFATNRKIYIKQMYIITFHNFKINNDLAFIILCTFYLFLDY